MQIKDEITLTLNIHEAKDLELALGIIEPVLREDVTFRANNIICDENRRFVHLAECSDTIPVKDILEMESVLDVLNILKFLRDKLL